MAKKVYEEENISNIAIAIREKTGGDKTYKTSEMVDGVREVYEAGQIKTLDDAESLNGKLQGAVVKATDVANIEHNVPCRVESKNLFNPYAYDTTNEENSSLIRVFDDGTISLDSRWDEEAEEIVDAWYAKYYLTLDKGIYTFTAVSNSGYDLYSTISLYINNEEVFVSSSENVESFTFELNTATNIQISMDKSTGASFPSFQAQLEKGSQYTGYVPYVEPQKVTVTRYGADESDNPQTYTPNADGTVDGITSLSPTMTLLTDTEGIIINANYYKDPNSLYEKGIEQGKQSEYDRFWDGFQRNGTRTYYIYEFFGYSWDRDIFYPKYDITVGGDCTCLLYNWNGHSGEPFNLKQRLEECGIKLDLSKARAITNIFGWSPFTELPTLDLTGCNQTYVSTIANLCTNCSQLETIEKIILAEHNLFANWFQNCKKLKNITFEGVIANNGLTMNACPLTIESLRSLISCLKDYSTDTSGTEWVVTVGSTNLAKLTDEDLANISAKGWVFK